MVLGDDMGQTTYAADSYRRLWASMLECVTVDMDTGGDGIVSGWSGRERVGIGNIGNVFENLQKVKIFNIEYAIMQLSNNCSTALISLPNISRLVGLRYTVLGFLLYEGRNHDEQKRTFIYPVWRGSDKARLH